MSASSPPSDATAWGLRQRRYQLELLLDLCFLQPFLGLVKGAEYRRFLWGRLGGQRPATGRGGLWIQAPAAGEIRLAASLVAALPETLSLTITTYFGDGKSRGLANKVFGSRAAVTYLPYALGPALTRFQRNFAPRAYVQIESRGWPLLPAMLHRPTLPIYMINGYVAERQWRVLSQPLFRPALARLTAVGAQSEDDRDRFVELGVPADRVHVTGSLKFELPEPEPKPELEAHLRRLAGGRPIVVAGSVEPGEESAIVLDAFGRLGGGERALLLLAPRGPSVVEGIERLAQEKGHATVRRTSLPDEGAPAVVMLDTLGELAGLYRVASAAFIGATLVPRGGHNPLEAARYAVPIAIGPSMEHFHSIATLFDRAEAWGRVDDAKSLADTWQQWLSGEAGPEMGARGARLLEENRGALGRTLELLAPVLEEQDRV